MLIAALRTAARSIPRPSSRHSNKLGPAAQNVDRDEPGCGFASGDPLGLRFDSVSDRVADELDERALDGPQHPASSRMSPPDASNVTCLDSDRAASRAIRLSAIRTLSTEISLRPSATSRNWRNSRSIWAIEKSTLPSGLPILRRNSSATAADRFDECRRRPTPVIRGCRRSTAPGADRRDGRSARSIRRCPGGRRAAPVSSATPSRRRHRIGEVARSISPAFLRARVR